MHPHRHYSVPILSNGKTLGVLNLYLKEGHIRNPKEEDFLRHVADTLAGIIMRKKAEDRVEYLAYFDNLTGLPNRNLFIDRLTQGIARAEYHNKLVAVLTLDIDRFKSINDTYGLEAGDVVLKAVAKMLTQSVREGDTVARIGGDGFGILLIDIAQSEDIILVVEKIMKNVSQTIHFGGKEIVLTISGGISAHPHDGKDASVLLKNADMALARAKQEGRKNYQFYTEGMDVKASEFVLMEKNLFNAIKNEEFILYYQPYWDINTKKIAGMEALIRWKSPEFGLVSPGKFIPVLEDTRMIIGVGEWILRTAIRQVKDWQDKGYPVVPVSVNLSLIQFRQKDIAQMIERIIREIGFSPSLLTLEITESAFMQDIEITRHDLENLKNIGVSISIDDFGTGYSSLAHLKRFPIDNLKIDISFIREIATDPDTASIVTAIIAMAHTLNLKTIAEGIETEEQWKILRLLRCDMGQGYFFSRPLPAEEAERMLI
jgi:diguanylate cyclase (GGDEF)-like protein